MGIIAKPIGYLLMWIYKLVGSYGIALIILTFIVKLVLYPLYAKQIKSSADMAEMSEKAQEIQRRYANDKEKQNEEMQKLYTEVGFNPMSGCLPMIIQFPIIMGLFESHVPLDSVTIMVQKEVADRMQVGPGTKDYGALSLAVQYYAKPEIVLNVPASCFMPRPNVDSAVIKLNRYQTPAFEVKNERLLFNLIKAAFLQRRKTMLNSVSNGLSNVTKEDLANALESMGLPKTVRGEALTLEQFVELANKLA